MVLNDLTQLMDGLTLKASSHSSFRGLHMLENLNIKEFILDFRFNREEID